METTRLFLKIEKYVEQQSHDVAYSQTASYVPLDNNCADDYPDTG